MSKQPFYGGFYFFYRFEIGDEPWPDFSSRSHWYDIYVFKGSSPFHPMSYSNQYSSVRNIHASLNITTSVKTQAGRKRAAAIENDGASMDHVDKQGHWATKSRSGAYANNVVPWEAVRVIAGFPPEPKRFYIDRALVKPSQSLQNAVFA